MACFLTRSFTGEWNRQGAGRSPLPSHQSERGVDVVKDGDGHSSGVKEEARPFRGTVAVLGRQKVLHPQAVGASLWCGYGRPGS